MEIEIGWGRAPRPVEVPDGARLLLPPNPPPAVSWARAVEAALAEARFDEVVGAARSAVVLVPDETRKDVAAKALPLLLPRLAALGVPFTVGVATGKHPPAPGPAGAWLHDARDPALRSVGTTAHGTDVRFPGIVLDADLRILVTEVRPHYFAGYAGGAKMLFPGVAGEAGIWRNHELKAAPGARLGVVDGNPCRRDLEEAAALAGPAFAINVVRHPGGGLVGATAGHPVASHRAAVALARPVFEVPRGERVDTVVVSDRHPVTMNLYQACKLLPPAGALLGEGGRVVVVAELGDGIGPIETINEKIYRLGIVHSLPPRHRVLLVSSRSREEVAPTFCEWAPDVMTAVGEDPRPLVLPYAADLVPR